MCFLVRKIWRVKLNLILAIGPAFDKSERKIRLGDTTFGLFGLGCKQRCFEISREVDRLGVGIDDIFRLRSTRFALFLSRIKEAVVFYFWALSNGILVVS